MGKEKTMPGSFREESQFHGRLKGTCFCQSTLAGWKGKELKDHMGLKTERQMKMTYLIKINKTKSKW